MRTLRPIAMLLLACAPLLSLSASDMLYLKNGTSISGELLGLQAGYVLIKIDQAEAFQRVDPQSIRRIHFSDADATPSTYAMIQEGKAEAALSQMTLHASKRSPLLGVLSPSDETLLIDYLQLSLGLGQATDALNFAKLWSPKLQYPQNQKTALLISLEAALACDRSAEALAHAMQWTSRYPNSFESALPWAVIAKDLLDSKKQSEKALFVALAPIAHQRTPKPEKVELCYAIAIEACQKSGAHDYAHALQSELESRSPATATQAKSSRSASPSRKLPQFLDTLSFSQLNELSP